MIGHVPPGDDTCTSEWASRLRVLQDRYQDVIRLSFFGHVHKEMFNLVRSVLPQEETAENQTRPIGIHHWSGAMTPFDETHVAHPSFRRYILDEITMLPIKI